MGKKFVLLGILVSLLSISGSAQGLDSQPRTFFDIQKTFKRPAESAARKEAYLKNLFALKGLTWPAKFLYIRSFKYDSQLEVWAKNKISDEYKLFKVYKVCALAGTLGPKRFEGDYQVPEGFYYIDRFNPNSGYYLSLGLNYPNASDRVLSDSLKPGGGIYIHGGCATVGCIPIRDEQIDELYILAASAKSAGLDFIPVHIFPIKFDVKKSYEYLAKLTKDDPILKAFSNKMEEAFDYFEKYKQIPVVMIKDNGEYVINNSLPLLPRFQPVARPKSTHVPVVRKIDKIPAAVTKWPEYQGGAEAYDAFLKKVGKEMVSYLPEEMKRAFVQVEFVVDKDGTPVNFKVLQGVDDYFDLELIAKLEKMPAWQPAVMVKEIVPKKMVQTLTIGD